MNSSGTCSGQRPRGRMKKEPNQDYPPDQRPIGKKIKIKGSPLSRDLDQVEVITEKVGGIIVKATELNNQERPGVGRLPRRPRRITLIKTTVGQKKVPNRNSKKPERTIDSPVLQTDLRQYDYLTSSNRPTTLSMMAKLNQDSGSEYIHNQLN